MFRAIPHGSLRAVALSLVLPLATLALVAAAPAELYFVDNFAGAGERAFFEGTLDNRTFRYVDGQYEIDTMSGQSYGQSVLVEDLNTYRVEVSGQLIESNDPDGGGFGLSFNYREREGGSDFLLLLIYDRGAFTILRYVDGFTSVLYSPTRTRLFTPGEQVRLTVDAATGRATCYINGAQVAELREERLLSGGFGLFTTAASVARFDDFRVYADLPEVRAFTDDMSGERNLYQGAFSGVSYAYEGGAYVIDTVGTEFIGLSPYPEAALNFEFVADVELISGDPVGGFGIYLRDYATEDGGFNQFRFLISGNWFAVEQSLDDLPLALAEWVQHAAVRGQGANQLKVRADDRNLVFFVNGVEVYRHVDERPHAGSHGFFASAGIKVAFDNVSFTELQ